MQSNEDLLCCSGRRRFCWPLARPVRRWLSGSAAVYYARSYRDQTDLATGQPYRGERARPVQMPVWYRAQQGGQLLRYADYVRTQATDEVFERTAAKVAVFMAERQQWVAAKVGTRQAQALLD